MFLTNVMVLTLFVSLSNCQFHLEKIIGDLGRSFGIHKPTSHRDVGDAPIYVTDQWIKSSTLSNNQIYLFAKDDESMTWYEADDYCGKRGAFLAEPFSKLESDFLRNQANRLPKNNWWIGLRHFEKCECISLGRSAKSVAAFTDPDSLQRTSNNGLGRTTCPHQNQKRCNGKEW